MSKDLWMDAEQQLLEDHMAEFPADRDWQPTPAEIQKQYEYMLSSAIDGAHDAWKERQ